MSTEASTSHFLIRRVHSLLGLLPIGIFLIFHMFLNLSANLGSEHYNKVIETMQSVPGIMAAEVVIIFIPILFHAIYGLWIVFTGQSNVLRYQYARNWFYLVQRVSGVLTVIFVMVHVVVLRFGEANFASMQSFMSNPLGLIFYVVGVLAAMFHFANGLWAFAITWGITVGPRAQKVWSYVCFILFVVMSAIGLININAFL